MEKEIIRRAKGSCLWRWKDAEGKYVYAVSAHDHHEPIYGYYSQAVAWEIFKDKEGDIKYD